MTAAEVMALIRASEKRFYCYVLRRPEGEPFYVGAGHGKRILDHERRDTRRDAKGSLIERVLGDDAVADYSVAGFFDTWGDAIDEEFRLIAFYGRLDLGTGPLANATSGGDGVPGVIWRQETLDKRSAALKGRPQSPERITQMVEAGKRQDVTPFIEGARRWREANRDAMVAERRGRWNNPEYRERQIKLLANPDRRAAISAVMYSRLADPKKRQKLQDAVRAARAQPVLINGNVYPTNGEAAKALGVHRSTILDRLREKVLGYSRIK